MKKQGEARLICFVFESQIFARKSCKTNHGTLIPMLLIMAVTIAVATFVLPLSLDYFGVTDLPLVWAAAIAVCLVCPLPVLLCGILHGINPVPEHRQSQRRCSLSVFVVELAIGRSKAYRIASVICFVCFPTSIIVFWILGNHSQMHFISFQVLVVWYAISFAVFFVASCMILFSIYSQVFSKHQR